MAIALIITIFVAVFPFVVDIIHRTETNDWKC